MDCFVFRALAEKTRSVDHWRIWQWITSFLTTGLASIEVRAVHIIVRTKGYSRSSIAQLKLEMPSLLAEELRMTLSVEQSCSKRCKQMAPSGPFPSG